MRLQPARSLSGQVAHGSSARSVLRGGHRRSGAVPRDLVVGCNTAEVLRVPGGLERGALAVADCENRSVSGLGDGLATHSRVLDHDHAARLADERLALDLERDHTDENKVDLLMTVRGFVVRRDQLDASVRRPVKIEAESGELEVVLNRLPVESAVQVDRREIVKTSG